MKPALSTIATFRTVMEAAYFRDSLEEAGIRTFVVDENLATINPFLAPAIGWVRLDVETGNAARAVAVVEEARRRSVKAGADEDPAGEGRCPACRGSLPPDSDGCASCGWMSVPPEDPPAEPTHGDPARDSLFLKAGDS